MKKGLILAVSCSLAFPTIAFAKTAHTKITPTMMFGKSHHQLIPARAALS
jgi:hypothetical protein